jgi:hypothetical protein
VGTDGISVGGDQGVEAGTDGVSVAGDDGVSVGTDGVSVGGDQGINLSTDGVSVVGQDLGPGSIGDGGGLPGAGGGEGLPIGNSSDGIPGLNRLIGPEGIIDTNDTESLDPDIVLTRDRLNLLGPAPNLGEEQGDRAADALGGSTDALPLDPLFDGVEALPTERAPGPQALPVGSESQIDCSVPVDAQDLPTEAVPATNELPVTPPELPLLPPLLVEDPANELTPVVFNLVPDTCDVYDPDDPSIDPTDPPTDPTATIQTNQIEFDDEAAKYLGESSGELEEGGPGYDALYLLQLDGEELRLMEELSITDGKTAGYLGLDSNLEVHRNLSEIDGDATVTLLGDDISAGLACGDITENQVEFDDPAEPCTFSTSTPFEEAATPEKIVDVIQDPPEYGLPQIDSGQLPVDL